VQGPPFGAFDTPADGSSGLTGSVAVTGWALDDVAVANVRLYRNPMAGEATAPNGKVYVGEGKFVQGARPDVAAAYPGFPDADAAGWGCMLLSNFLPNGGNENFTFYVYATDTAGATTLLGAKKGGFSNATATKPFGTLDTPAPGETLTGGIYRVWGWALTPNPGVIPANGSTITVYVDGVPSGRPTYNLYRSDIVSLFPDLANAGGAGGYYDLDSSLLANGLHTIAWSVRDNLGRVDGIGPRFFGAEK